MKSLSIKLGIKKLFFKDFIFLLNILFCSYLFNFNFSENLNGLIIRDLIN